MQRTARQRKRRKRAELTIVWRQRPSFVFESLNPDLAFENSIDLPLQSILLAQITIQGLQTPVSRTELDRRTHFCLNLVSNDVKSLNPF